MVNQQPSGGVGRAARSVVRTAAGGVGSVLRSTFALVARARPADKPLHPVGAVSRATLHRYGLTPSVGVTWLDEPGQDEVLVRFSRALGVPGPFPDVLGLAVRIPLPSGGFSDVLMSTTGTGRLTRFLLRPTATADDAAYSTLLPYRSSHGPLWLAARTVASAGTGARELQLCASGARGPWRPFGTLVVHDDHSDAEVSFDPVLNRLPDLPFYDWVQRMREGAYAAARTARGEPAASAQ